MGMIDERRNRVVLGTLLAAALVWPVASAQDEAAEEEVPRPRPTSFSERMRKLEARIADLEAEAESRDKADKKVVEKNYSKGILSLGGLELRFGGQVKIDVIDPQNENDPIFGKTESPDPHFNVERVRLAPQVEFLKSKEIGEFSMRAHLDFKPDAGDTLLKRATFDHQIQPFWWLESHEKVGLDDRFIRPGRLTQNYPLIGNAFWRDQETGFFWEGTIGAKRGRPEEKAGKKKGKGKAGTSPEELTREMQERAEGLAAGEDEVGEPVPARDEMTRSTIHEPFDFVANPGALKLHFSVTNGLPLDSNEVGKAKDAFNDLLQDDRDLGASITARELGLGVGYERDFREFGEFEVLAFYYDDELSDEEVAFIQGPTGLNQFAPDGTFIGGYGFSDDRTKDRMGISVEYHYESYHLLRALNLLDRMLPDKGDGLYLFYQYIEAVDGDLDRDGWYAQASFRISNPYWRKFLKTFEPVVRYSELHVDTPHIPSLPLTWSRKQWLVGMVTEIVKDVYLRSEYAINDETTGGGSVANNELLFQLLLEF